MTYAHTTAELKRLARDHFGITHFRPGQRELIQAVLSGRDAVGVMPTGAGKSLTYQLPALVARGPVLVVSPLLALIQDQHEKLTELGVRAAKLDSTVSPSEQAAILSGFERGEHALLYVTPERLERAEQLEALKSRKLALLVVDEAHCVSQWGHDFRPAYLAVRDAVRDLGRPPVLALTATATPEVLADIQRQLDMRDPVIVNTGIERTNLFFEVLRTPSEHEKHERLRHMLSAHDPPGLIYCATVRVAEELHRWLEPHGRSVDLYHGKLPAARREETQRRFMDDELELIVATNAFGMGVDKPNIRFVVHYNFPDSLETYYQEAGRAGRDGEPARATLLYRLEDKRVQSYFLGGKYPKREDTLQVIDTLAQLGAAVPIKKLAEVSAIGERHCKVIAAQLEQLGVAERKRGRVRLLRVPSASSEWNALLDEYAKRRDQDRQRLDSMMRYAQSARCRTQVLHEYFDEPYDRECGHCDNCQAHAEGRAAAGVDVPLAAGSDAT